jgi:hypothetical protein
MDVNPTRFSGVREKIAPELAHSVSMYNKKPSPKGSILTQDTFSIVGCLSGARKVLVSPKISLRPCPNGTISHN